MSIKSLVLSLLRIAIRGGVDMRAPAILIILFMSIPVTTIILTNGYISQLYSLSELIGSPQYYLSYISRDNSVEVLYASINAEIPIIVVSPSNITEFLRIHRVKIIKLGQEIVYVGKHLYESVNVTRVLNLLGIDNMTYSIILSSDYVSNSIIIPRSLAERTLLKWNKIYESKYNISNLSVPSFNYTVQQIRGNVGSLAYSINILIIFLMVICLLSSTYIAYKSSRETYKLTLIVNIGKWEYYMGIFLLSIIIAATFIIVSISLSIILTHIVTFIVSKNFQLPFIRPQLPGNMIDVVIIYFITIVVALTVGGCSGRKWYPG